MKQNKLIVLGGFAGAGKTTIAGMLARDFNFSFFNPDDFNDALRKALNKENFDDVAPVAYQTFWHVLKKNIKMGATCILDANMCSEITWTNLDKIKAEFPDLTIVPIILVCSLEVHKARIEERGRTNKEHLNMGGKPFEEALPKYDYINALQRDDIIRVDANGSVEEVYQQVLKVLQLKA